MIPDYHYLESSQSGNYQLDRLEGRTMLLRFRQLQKRYGKRVPDDDVVRFLHNENLSVLRSIHTEDGPDFEQARKECIELYEYVREYYVSGSRELQKKIAFHWFREPLVFRLATVYRDSPVVDGLTWRCMQDCVGIVDRVLHPGTRYTMIFAAQGDNQLDRYVVPSVVRKSDMKYTRREVDEQVLQLARCGGDLFLLGHVNSRTFTAEGYHFEEGRCMDWNRGEVRDHIRPVGGRGRPYFRDWPGRPGSDR